MELLKGKCIHSVEWINGYKDSMILLITFRLWGMKKLQAKEEKML